MLKVQTAYRNDQILTSSYYVTTRIIFNSTKKLQDYYNVQQERITNNVEDLGKRKLSLFESSFPQVTYT